MAAWRCPPGATSGCRSGAFARRGRLTLLAGETVTVDIPLEMAVRVHGVVRAKDTQKPLEGVTLSVLRYDGVGRQGDEAVTDEMGEYSALALGGEVYVELISLPPGYVQFGDPSKERRTVPADAKEYEWPPIDVVPSIEIAGKLIDRTGKPMANVHINGVGGNRRYGFGNTDENGGFILTNVPKGIRFEYFQIWTHDEHFTGVVETQEPLVVRVEK